MIECLVKLYDFPVDHGTITALDSNANIVYVGTSKGMLLRCSVEGTKDPGEVAHGGRMSSGLESSGDGDIPPATMYTNILRRVMVSDRGKPVAHLQHSPTHTILFVLCDDRLCVWDSESLVFLMDVAFGVQLFFAYSAHREDDSHRQNDSNGHANPQSFSSRSESSTSTGLHYICTALGNDNCLVVYELDASLGARARAARIHQLQLPDPALALVVSDGVACVGMAHDYVLMSLATGASHPVLRRHGGRLPLVGLGDGEVYLRSHHAVFTVAVPSAPTAAGIGDAPRRTLPVEEEAQLIVSRFPFVLVFTDTKCVVFSSYEDEAVEWLPLPGCLYASQLARGDNVLVASPQTIWMLRLCSLRHQLADLVKLFRVEEAFNLLEAQRKRSRQSLQSLEKELHIMAGFAYLHHGRCKEAMHLFSDDLDPRDLLVLIPECTAVGHHQESETSRRLLRSSSPLPASNSTADTAFRKVECSVVDAAELEGSTVAEPLPPLAASSLWAEWPGPCPYNTVSDIQRAWLETFESFPAVPHTGRSTASPVHMMRQVPQLGAVTTAMFLERCWSRLKDAVRSYFSTRLTNLNADGTSVRVMEYVLLILSLELEDHRAVYRLVSCGRGLQVEDVYHLFLRLKEYRLLSCLLHRRGYVREAEHLLRSRVYVSSYFTPLQRQPVPSMESINRILTPLTDITMKVAWAEVLPMRALFMLPPGTRLSVQRTLLRMKTPFTSAAQDAAREDATVFHRWLVDTAQQYRERMRDNFTHRLVARQGWNPCITGCAAWPHVGPAQVILDGALVPTAYAEVFYLIEKMNVVGLRFLLQSQPELVHCRDAEGHGPLHLLFSLLSLLDEQEEGNGRLTLEQRTDALQLLLAAMSALLDAGCPTDTISSYGLSVLDVAAASCDGAYLDVVTAGLQSCVEVGGTCRQAGSAF